MKHQGAAPEAASLASFRGMAKALPLPQVSFIRRLPILLKLIPAKAYTSGGPGNVASDNPSRKQFLPTGQTARGFRAVNRIDLAGYICRVVRGQKRKQRRDLLGLGVALQGNLAVYFLQHLVRVLGALHGCKHVP